jgi:dipeptide/tripeptide permease
MPHAALLKQIHFEGSHLQPPSAVTALCHYVQDNISWAIGFGIPAAAMVLAIVLFVAGSKSYTHVPPTER